MGNGVQPHTYTPTYTHPTNTLVHKLLDVPL